MALRVFGSLADAKREGYEVYDRAPVVVMVRRKNSKAPLGWELAAVQLTGEPKPKQNP